MYFICDIVGIFIYVLNEEVVVLGIFEGIFEWLYGEGFFFFIGEFN